MATSSRRSHSYKTKVPDGQVFSYVNTPSEGDAKFYLTIEVKPGKQAKRGDQEDNKSVKERKPKKRNIQADKDAAQTWNQALVGIANSDTSYGILITPSYARIYELHILDPMPTSIGPGKYKSLTTSTKTISFVELEKNTKKFRVKGLLDLIEAITCIMLEKISMP